MADFNTLREHLRIDREQIAQAEEVLLRAREAHKQAVARLAALERVADANQPDAAAQLTEAQTDVDKTQTLLEKRRAFVQLMRERVRVTAAAFHQLSDPALQIENLSSRIPLLMFPLRLETRFKRLVDRLDPAAPPKHELWVRVFPDDCLINTFEETLSENELRSAERYWQSKWEAGRVVDLERAAWRALCSTHGSGRAEWIQQRYRPINEFDQPTRIHPNEIILVVSTTTVPSPTVLNAANVFWSAIWKANRNLELENAARQALINQFGEVVTSEVTSLYRPFNLSVAPPPGQSRESCVVKVAFLILPSPPSKQLSWNRPPRCELLPDRLVLKTYFGGVEEISIVGQPIDSPLVVGTDPAAPPEEQLHADDNGDLIVPEDMKWMVDFDNAIARGMGFRVSITAQQAARGFDRLLVLGVRTELAPEEGQKLVELLFMQHHYGRSGIALVPQGTPTNNTEGNTSGHSRIDDADASFDRLFGPGNSTPSSTDAFHKCDGQWLVEMLGLNPDALKTISAYASFDQAEAKAMNRLLSPATIRYFMRTSMHPLFEKSDDIVDFTTQFMELFVSGRGAIPAIRIGAQPYGILPVAAFQSLAWFDSPGASPFQRYLGRLHGFLNKLGQHWRNLSRHVSALGRPSADPHQALLNILGLQPTSAEFHVRFAQSQLFLFNLVSAPDAQLFFGVSQSAIDAAVQFLKENFNVVGVTPAQTEFHYFKRPVSMRGSLVDNNPLSEFETIHHTGNVTNYLVWLAESQFRELDELRREISFQGSPPTALLYLLARHALMLGWHDAAYRLYLKASLPIDEFKKEPELVHLPLREQSNSRWRPLYQTSRVSGNNLLWEHIQKLIHQPPVPQVQPLVDQYASLKRLADLPTARLERLLVEHLDCVSYRYDAWLLGLCHAQLNLMRYDSFDGQLKFVNPGIYVGAFSWLENVSSENKVLKEVELDAELAEVFHSGEELEPITRDSTNGGYIHAPSLNHATTAAVLRNGYISTRTSDHDPALAVNLSSNRVRLALSFLEGLRNGQSLGALLGYQLERGLHDAYNLASCDALIYDLRDAFPLRSNNLQSTMTSEAEMAAAMAFSPKTKPIESLEARNVVDGLKLIEQTRIGGELYPFGLPPTKLPELRNDRPEEAAILNAINSEVQRLLDVHDALGDLALAEGVHQATQGNYDRASAALTSMTTGNCPPVPAVVQTPTKGMVLTHRVGLHLDIDIVAPPTATPRQLAEPALNQWLAERLPSMRRVACTVRWFTTDRDLNGLEHEITVEVRTVLMSELRLAPLDWLALIPLEARGQMTELDDRVMRHVFAIGDPHPGIPWRIEYETSPAGPARVGVANVALPADTLTVYEIATLSRSLNTLIQKSRPLTAVDLSRSERSEPSALAPHHAQDINRVRAVIDRLQTVEIQLAGAHIGLSQLLLSPDENFDEIIHSLDGKLADAVSILEQAARFGILLASWGNLYKARMEFHASLRKTLDQRIQTWQPRWQAFQAARTAYQALPQDTPEEIRVNHLRQALVLLVAAPDETLETLVELEQFVSEMADQFSEKLAAMQAMLEHPPATIVQARTSLEQILPLAPFDNEALDADALDTLIVNLLQQMQSTLLAVHREVQSRLSLATSKLLAVETSSDTLAVGKMLIEAARSLLSDEFCFIPRFTLSSDVAAEWNNAFNASSDGSLLSYLTDDLKVDFPVDQWLYGVARVRPQIAHWERMLVHGDSLRQSAVVGPGEQALPLASELVPIQLPFRPGEPWLALDYPADLRPQGDHLLYTAAYAKPFDGQQPCGGLLIDQWTEVIPAVDPPGFKQPETEPAKSTYETGLAFHYDRPNNEAPQTFLLVLPTDWLRNSQWQWSDVIGALNSGLDLAQQRAVEPDALQQTGLAQFLPATNMAKTEADISIGTLLARNNGVRP